MKRKMSGIMLCVVLLLGNLVILNAGLKTNYRIIKNPFRNQAVNYKQAKYLKILLKKLHGPDAKIRILLKLVELFKEEEIKSKDGIKIKLKNVIADLKARGRSYMAEFTDSEKNEKAWIWFE